MRRREFLAGTAGVGAMALAGTGAGAGVPNEHPGPPRFLTVGEAIDDELWQGGVPPEPVQRDDLAPRIPNPDSAHGSYADAPADSAYSWSLASKPAGSTATIDAGTDAAWGDPDNADDVIEFAPDVAGEYRLQLQVDGGATTYEQLVRAFPTPSDGSTPPRIRLDGTYDAGANEYTLTATPAAAPNGNADDDGLTVEIYRDDRTSGTDSQRRVASGTGTTTHTVDAANVTGTVRFHAVAYDGTDGHSVVDTLHLDSGSVERWNDPPEWVENATVYEIFTRSWAGDDAQQTTFSYLESRVPYLADDLGVDAVWLTPIVAATSTDPGYGGGGHHGYDTENYFETASDLGTLAEYESFVRACHDNGLKVVFDLVGNHVSDQHDLYRNGAATDDPYGDWFKRDANGDVDAYFGWTSLKNLDYGNPAVREHLLAVVDQWAPIVDGFRCDVAYGVPHGFWKEVRERVRAVDTDFLMLDETIPASSEYSEGEFGMHFGTALHYTLRDIARGDAAPTALLDTVEKRRDSGFPDSAGFLQYLGNHDENRFLDVGTPSQQRAAAAATFTLPGTPMVYYGEEILLNRGGEYDDEAREPMQWSGLSTAQQANRQFYRNLIDLRSGENAKPSLQSDADFRPVYYESDSADVVAYGRETGGDAAVVVLNFGAESASVDLRSTVGTTDRISGKGVGSTSDGTTTVTVDDALVLDATPPLLGDRLARWRDEAGDDYGPGTYRYPTGDGVYDGAFDLTGFEIYDRSEDYVFLFELAGGVQNPDGAGAGFSAQFPQVYLDTGSGATSTAGRPGLNVGFASAYDRRVVADGYTDGSGVSNAVEAADGSVVSESVTAATYPSVGTGAIGVTAPKSSLGDLTDAMVVPVLLGSGDGPGRVRPVDRARSTTHFGGGADDATDTNVLDTIQPRGTRQSSALNDGGSLELLSVRRGMRHATAGGRLLAEWDDPTGDDDGPGGYTYPTDEAFYDGAFDLTNVAIYETSERYKFVFTVAEGFENPFGGSGGFSLQYPHLYVHDPEGSGGATASSGGRNVTFERPFHYRIAADGFRGGEVVDGGGTELSGDVSATAHESFEGIVVDAPKSPISDISEMDVAPLLFGEDSGGIRGVAASNGEYTFGGGSDGDTDPHVVDMVTPGDTDQSAALSYDSRTRATIPYVAVDETDPVVAAVAGDDGEVSLADIAEAREHWESGEPLNGQRIDYRTLRRLLEER
ncbi:glucodextranase DOMON-like domain-containing protein [Haloarcula marina]|uniref:glucodextranase DOMON-like domain-containing protein n=1 Tax=Haloarcula marina TaxID=2961574 RepID=UPI0020B736EA|nr:glucodextranase DOMON-like domain-containing protein [Halomicroarcula marina]